MKVDSELHSVGFWHPWLEVNRKQAIFHQWEELENSGSIDNFRILAGEKEGHRTGWFFADSDAYKWLEAAARIYAHAPALPLKEKMDAFIDLIARAQASDGYIYTYNQLLFPDQRWINLQIEHELYCHGHLIEAGVSHFQATGSEALLQIVRRAADCIVEKFVDGTPEQTPGHQEIEIALLRLYEITQHTPYLEMARQFIARRGNQKCFGWKLLPQFIDSGKREKQAKESLETYRQAHPQQPKKSLPPANYAKHRLWTDLRWYVNALQGKYFQQHQPVDRQRVSVGHSVRFAYLQTAIAKICQIIPDEKWQSALEHSWQRMAERRMYITGGIGSLPAIEGFGRDYELDPEFAYAETCAAIGSIYWNWEMAKLTHRAQYSDLLEWQLYNAALVGMGLNGKCYLYNNPLASHGKIERRAWYEIPCCPSNLSRTWEKLQEFVVSGEQDVILIHQYLSSRHQIISEASHEEIELTVDSSLPYSGDIRIQIRGRLTPSQPIKLRKPSWTDQITITVNGRPLDPIQSAPGQLVAPWQSEWITLTEDWQAKNEIHLQINLPVRMLKTHPRVKGHQHRVALARGPIVYCLESCDQPAIDIFNVVLGPHPITEKSLPPGLGDGVALAAQSTTGEKITLIPYHLWGNRGAANMTVWMKTEGQFPVQSIQ